MKKVDAQAIEYALIMIVSIREQIHIKQEILVTPQRAVEMEERREKHSPFEVILLSIMPSFLLLKF